MGKEPPARPGVRAPLPPPRAEVTSAVRIGPSVRRVAAWTEAVLAAAAPRRSESVSVLLCGDGEKCPGKKGFRSLGKGRDAEKTCRRQKNNSGGGHGPQHSRDGPHFGGKDFAGDGEKAPDQKSSRCCGDGNSGGNSEKTFRAQQSDTAGGPRFR